MEAHLVPSFFPAARHEPRAEPTGGPMKTFGDRLAAAVRLAGNPVVVGLDPRWDELPEPIKSAHSGNHFDTRAAAYAQFCRGVIDAVSAQVPAVKPQVAFFEQLGPPGMRALAE